MIDKISVQTFVESGQEYLELRATASVTVFLKGAMFQYKYKQGGTFSQ